MILFFCTLTFFVTFGTLLFTLLIVTIIYTNTFLAPLLLLIGPSDEPTPFEQAAERVMRRCLGACLKALGLDRFEIALPRAFRHSRQVDDASLEAPSGGGRGVARGSSRQPSCDDRMQSIVRAMRRCLGAFLRAIGLDGFDIAL